MSDSIAVISDIHANLFALRAVLEDVKARNITRYWCLGDMTGRGPYQTVLQTVNLLSGLYQGLSTDDQMAWLIGNHDRAVLGLGNNKRFESPNGDFIDVSSDSAMVNEMAEKHRIVLESHQKLVDWLGSFSSYAKLRSEIYLAHGAYYYSDEDEEPNLEYSFHYALNAPMSIEWSYQNITRHLGVSPRLLVYGHTHIPTCMHMNDERHFVPEILEDNKTYTYSNLTQYPVALNPGSVGFPRTYPYIPSYMVLDMDDESDVLQVTYHTVKYDKQVFLDKLPKDYPQAYRREIEKHCSQDLNFKGMGAV